MKSCPVERAKTRVSVCNIRQSVIPPIVTMEFVDWVLVIWALFSPWIKYVVTGFIRSVWGSGLLWSVGLWIFWRAVPHYFYRTVLQYGWNVVLPAFRGLIKSCETYFHVTYVFWYEYIAFKHLMRVRRYRLMAAASRRTRKVLECLDDTSLGDDELTLIERKEHVRCAVLMSRRARIGLKYPKYSAANEKIACDWIDRHCPESMTLGIKHKVLPLAIKLTFVRSQHEIDAEHHFSWLEAMVDHA